MTGAFRRQWLGTLPLGILDVCLHVTATVLLPGPWWLQWLPDAALPLLWTQSMWRDRWAGDGSNLLALHRALHLRRFHYSILLWWPLSMLLAWQLGIHVAVPVIHLLAHVAIDRLTHDGRWQ